MKALLESNIELVVESGFIYLPLLFDPSIKREIQTLHRPEGFQESSNPQESKTIIENQGNYFVKTLSLQSLLSNYETINKDSYEQLKTACMRKYHLNPEIDSITIDGKLRKILFQVMPYFIRKDRGLERGRFSEEEILDLVGEKIDVPKQYDEKAEAFLDMDHLREMLAAIENKTVSIEPPRKGLQSAHELREWFITALDVKILEREYDRLRQALKVREQFRQTSEKHIGILLYIADTGMLEIDNFGFNRIRSPDEYLVYKHTGEYILKDYYARSYLFSDCRVAVSTSGPFRPVVMEMYKHPFLLWHRSGQEICMRDFYPPTEFTPENIINAIEEGINALLYGYDSRKRNGYHSLDKTTQFVETVVFQEYVI
ncbi:hypothetical protein ACFL03_03355 [Thermodesulfobacteriota bacterium]